MVLTDPAASRNVDGFRTGVIRFENPHLFGRLRGKRLVQPGDNFERQPRRLSSACASVVYSRNSPVVARREQVIDAVQLHEVGASSREGAIVPAAQAALRDSAGTSLIELRLNDEHGWRTRAIACGRVEREKAAVERCVHPAPDLGRQVFPAFARDDRIENLFLLLDCRLLRRARRSALLQNTRCCSSTSSVPEIDGRGDRGRVAATAARARRRASRSILLRRSPTSEIRFGSTSLASTSK